MPTVNDIVFIESLTEALGSSDNQSLEEIKTDLHAGGIDVENSIAKVMKYVDEVTMKNRRQKLQISKSQRIKKEEIRLLIKKQISKLSKNEIISTIKENINILGEVAFAYRDLESKPIEDIQSLLEDLEMARIIKEKNLSDNEL